MKIATFAEKCPHCGAELRIALEGQFLEKYTQNIKPVIAEASAAPLEPSDTFKHLFNADGTLKDGRKGHVNACDLFVPEKEQPDKCMHCDGQGWTTQADPHDGSACQVQCEPCLGGGKRPPSEAFWIQQLISGIDDCADGTIPADKLRETAEWFMGLIRPHVSLGDAEKSASNPSSEEGYYLPKTDPGHPLNRQPDETWQLNKTVMALQAFLDYSARHRMCGQPVWRQLLENARVAIREELSKPKRESLTLEQVHALVKGRHGRLLGDIFIEAGDVIYGGTPEQKRKAALDFIDAIVKSTLEMQGRHG